MKQSDEQINRLLNEHLSRKLDPMLGRSVARFQLAIKPTASRTFWNRTVLSLGAIGISAIAAAVAMAITLFPTVPQSPATSGGGGQVAAADPSAGNATPADKSEVPLNAPAMAFNDDFAPQHVASQLIRRTIDEGTVYFDDGTPMRRIRERELQHSFFVDPRTGRLLEVRVPSETVRLMGMQKY